jgi:hypothetical protein
MIKTLTMWLAAMAIAATTTRGQGAFQDLDFEAAKLIYITNSDGSISIATTNALPGWAAFSGTNRLSMIAWLAPGIVPSIQLTVSNLALQGNFSVGLDNGSISQTGLVPPNSSSLLFDFSAPLPLSVFLNGQALSIIDISNAVNSAGLKYTVYGADISIFAGQIQTLTFSARYGGGILDDIQFSSQPIPEPSVFSLVCFCGGVLVYVTRRRHR